MAEQSGPRGGAGESMPREAGEPGQAGEWVWVTDPQRPLHGNQSKQLKLTGPAPPGEGARPHCTHG